MTFLVSAVLILIMVGVIAMLMKDGLWSNALMLINMMLAGLVASNYYEPLAKLLTKQERRGFYLWDVVVLWLLFGVTLLIFRAITDNLSKINVRFPILVEGIGSPLLAVAVGWYALCFVAMSLHVAPLEKEPFKKGFKSQEKMLFGLAPDRIWMGTVRTASKGV